MSKLTIVVFSLFGLISASVGQGIVQPGQCDENVAVLTDFVVTNYTGIWYDIESFPSTFQNGTCITAEYTLSNAGLNILNSQVDSNGVRQTSTGIATAQTGQPPGTAKFNVLFTGNTQSVPYWVLDTDYTTFALVYTCRNVTQTSRQVNSWKLGRNQGPLPAAAIARINTKIASEPSLSPAANLYVPSDHSIEACSYFVELDGQCATTLNGADNFDASIFQGTWYEFARYRQATQTGQCNRAEYVVGANGVVNVQNSQVISQALNTISGVAFGVAGRPGVLQVNFNVGGELRSQNLVVLATDNTNYALLYSCTNVGQNRRRIGSWKLRKQLAPLNATYITAINNAVNANTDLQEVHYRPTSQSDAACFYYPQWDTLPATIDLPGRCNTTITGAANFNAQTFLGTWYEVARYPQPTQGGQCNRATYGPVTGGAITVQNRQVNAETLSTISGQATAVAGQTGVLQVTLNTSSGPTNQTLYVLATDNTNYALLYSCTNLDGNRRRVGSWKMSKQLGPLSAAANNSINSVIEATEGLNQSYYQTTNQSDAACFYYPQWDTLPATIDLPGPCNTTITGLAGFNAQRFLGTWYEVAKYPQPTQGGQCNRAEYQLVGGVITVRNSEVIAETLNTILGQASAVAGQSGVLQVTLNTSGGPVIRTLYVLDTDYDNYALLYSCSNIDGNTRRRVGSWQMRRHLGPLNAEQNAAISNKIDTTQGLNQNYYLPTSQSDAACFYYPQWDTLPATIDLPGPCNTTITGAANFNAQTFLGTWYEVARYPQPTQGGQCNRATYGPVTGGAITVQNRQVNAETLSTISGQATAVAGQTGVLQVTLNTSSGPTNQTLYVLATDNTNYALLYSCTNLDGNRRRVGSWRLSKQLEPLPAATNTIINNVIANTQGLSLSYYQPTSQADAACFYYPTTQAGEKVIIPGQCDANISGQTNIDMARFANGTWYHIQRYDQVGNRTCIGTRLSMDEADEENFVNVNSIEVVGGVENRTEGIARLTSAANGQFSLVWSGSNDTTTVTIMATNYDGFAIAYSCENSGNSYRQVGVWLLSRQRTWPATGVTALAQLVNNRQEFTLRDGYFKVIPHNETCPEPSSAFLFKSSIIVIFVCTVLQFVW